MGLETSLPSKVDGTAGVKVYRALVGQSGTDAPVSTVRENSLGGVPVWAYVDVGEYTLTLAGAWTANKTFPLWANGLFSDASVDGVIFQYERVSADVLRFWPKAVDGLTAANWSVTAAALEILVYP